MVNRQLYKFVSSLEHAEDIASGKIRFARVSELNDPMELAPRLDRDEVTESLNDLRRRGHSDAELIDLHRQAAMMQKLAPHLQALPVPKTKAEADQFIRSSFFDHFEILESAFETMIASIIDNSCVACFTQRWNSLPMWAHYAARGHGMVICYESLDHHFMGDETGWLNEPQLVRYEDKLHGISFYPESYARIFFTKFRDWQYEMEVRLVSEASSCLTDAANGNSNFYKPVPKTCVTEFIFGWLVPDDVIANVQKRIQSIGIEHLHYSKMKFRKGEFSRSPVN